MRRVIALAVAAFSLSACTDTQITWWLAASPDQHIAAVETIERQAAAEFGVDGDLLVRILGCESHQNPLAVNARSGALGLGQHLPSLYGPRAAALGYDYDSWSDPVANARVSAALMAADGTAPWNPSRACWA